MQNQIASLAVPSNTKSVDGCGGTNTYILMYLLIRQLAFKLPMASDFGRLPFLLLVRSGCLCGAYLECVGAFGRIAGVSLHSMTRADCLSGKAFMQNGGGDRFRKTQKSTVPSSLFVDRFRTVLAPFRRFGVHGNPWVTVFEKNMFPKWTLGAFWDSFSGGHGSGGVFWAPCPSLEWLSQYCCAILELCVGDGMG